MPDKESLDGFEESVAHHSIRRQNDRLKAELKQRDDQLAQALGRISVLEGIDNLNPKPPKWALPKKRKPNAAVVCAILSDTHWDEIVRQEDVAGVNAYDRTIATKRLKEWATKLAAVPTDGPSADYEGLVLMLGGDLTCGLIDTLHLVESSDTLMGSLLYWTEQAAAAISLLADSYGHVHVPVVVGNHGRMTAKKRTHLKARDNSDWHLAHLIRRQLSHDDRVTWQIDEASDAEFDVLGHRMLLTHGDSVKGGGGIGGVFPPIMRMVARKQQRQASLDRPFSHLWLGHFHQAIYGPGWTCNGSLKGYDGYAAEFSFPADPPCQVVSLVSKEGIEWRTAIRVK
jgi:hypothetical protein